MKHLVDKLSCEILADALSDLQPILCFPNSGLIRWAKVLRLDYPDDSDFKQAGMRLMKVRMAFEHSVDPETINLSDRAGNYDPDNLACRSIYLERKFLPGETKLRPATSRMLKRSIQDRIEMIFDKKFKFGDEEAADFSIEGNRLTTVLSMMCRGAINQFFYMIVTYENGVQMIPQNSINGFCLEFMLGCGSPTWDRIAANDMSSFEMSFDYVLNVFKVWSDTTSRL